MEIDIIKIYTRIKQDLFSAVGSFCGERQITKISHKRHRAANSYLISDTAIARKQRQRPHSLASNTDEGAHVASPDADSKARFDSLDLRCETSLFF